MKNKKVINDEEEIDWEQLYPLSYVWKKMIECLYEIEKDKIEDFCNSETLHGVNVEAMEKEFDYIKNLQLLDSAVTLVEKQMLDYKDLKKCSQFIKRDFEKKDDLIDFLFEIVFSCVPFDDVLFEKHEEGIINIIYGQD